MTTRRDFLRVMGAGAAIMSPMGAAACHVGAVASTRPPSAGDRGWDLVPGILARIVPPAFPNREFDVTRFGAKGDGARTRRGDRDAIAACASAGGGRVVVPAGRFVTGPIQLESNVDLHVAHDATSRSARDPRQYLPAVLTRFEGVELMNYSPFIYAFDQENIAITGEGTLDGQADREHWWPWKGWRDSGERAARRPQRVAAALLDMAERGVPVEAPLRRGHYLRPKFIQPYRCTNVLIEGVTIVELADVGDQSRALRERHGARREDLAATGRTTTAAIPESCRDVLIEGCMFDTGDDCIAIKSGRNADGRRVNVPGENIIVRDCVMRDGHGGVTIGSEITGGAATSSRTTAGWTARASTALRFKNNAMRGGVIERRLHARRDGRPGGRRRCSRSTSLRGRREGAFTPVVRDIEVRNVTSRESKYGVYFRGFARAPIETCASPTALRRRRERQRHRACKRPRHRGHDDQRSAGSVKYRALAIAVALPGLARTQTTIRPSGGSGERPWSVRVAESVVKRNPAVVFDKWDYTAGLVLLSMQRLRP